VVAVHCPAAFVHVTVRYSPLVRALTMIGSPVVAEVSVPPLHEYVPPGPLAIAVSVSLELRQKVSLVAEAVTLGRSMLQWSSTSPPSRCLSRRSRYRTRRQTKHRVSGQAVRPAEGIPTLLHRMDRYLCSTIGHAARQRRGALSMAAGACGWVSIRKNNTSRKPNRTLGRDIVHLYFLLKHD
jgi:hypothetical protein